MNTFFSNFAQRAPAAALMLGALLLVPLRASAQELPSYAAPVAASTDETIHGRIASVDSAFNITVDDDRGFVDNVELHQGTIINPTGLALNPGMSVTIEGYNAGSMFDANEIDTPYSYSGPIPTPVYYGDGYWCPGFAYGYGPSFSLAIIFGFGDGHRGGYHFEHRPFHREPRNGRASIGYSGSHRYDSRNFSGERRAPTAGLHGAYGHTASAFYGRSFAGAVYTGARYSGGGARYGAGGAGYRVGGYLRSAPAPSGFARTGPAAGGFSRSGGGGFARGGGGAGRH